MSFAVKNAAGETVKTYASEQFARSAAEKLKGGSFERIGTLDDADEFFDFLTAGKATFTIVSSGTGARFTYRVTRKRDDDDLFFVSVLVGHDNERDYRYIACFTTRGVRMFRAHPPGYVLSARGRSTPDAPSFKAIDWLLRQIAKHAEIPSNVEIYHAGRCARCGRKLTTPKSIESGFGPECIKRKGS